MLLETTLAFYEKLNSINEDERIKSLCTVDVLTSENYRENIANAERKKTEIHYPVIIVHDGNQLNFDVTRFSNDKVYKKSYRKDDGNYYSKAFDPLIPYNLPYRVEIVCKKREQLDSILIWVMQNIQSRDYLEVTYDDEDNGESKYDAIVKRGPIVNADEGTSSTLYRRTFELTISTLIDNKFHEEIVVTEHKPQFYQVERSE